MDPEEVDVKADLDAETIALEIAELRRALAKELDRQVGELHGLGSSDVEPSPELHAPARHELSASQGPLRS